MDKDQLFEKAKEAALHAYAKYSNFPVGACVLTHQGEMFCGVNVENASHPCGQCAEASAIGNMITQVGPQAKIKAIAVVADVEEGVLPCGNCLQRISEFSHSGSMCILSANFNGIQREFWLDDLMPYRFRSEK